MENTWGTRSLGEPIRNGEVDRVPSFEWEDSQPSICPKT